MGIYSKRQYLQTIRLRYKYAAREQKSHILDEFCSVCGYNRKYAIWLLNANGTKKPKSKTKPAAGQSTTIPDLLEVLMEIWKEAELPGATRLKEIIPNGCRILRNSLSVMISKRN